MKILSVKKITQDENHNAFTDLVRYKGKYYLAYRACPDGHMLFPSSRIVIMSSCDGEEWKRVYDFNIPGRDTRDPHFLEFNDKLFVYTGTWKIIGNAPPYERDPRRMKGYLCFTSDGESWTAPQYAEGTKGYYIWRTGTFGGKAYMCGRRYEPTGSEYIPLMDEEGFKSVIMESSDGFVWSEKGIIQTKRGDETSFLFEKNGDVIALSRVMERNTQWRTILSQLSFSSPPYDKWTNIELNERLECPLLFKLGEEYMAAGRWFKRDPSEEHGIRITMAVFYLRNNHLELAAEIQSGGDSSYPGFADMGGGRGLLSYYSSHEDSSSIYIAEIEK